jgi:large subunit ribosomal protein L25
VTEQQSEEALEAELEEAEAEAGIERDEHEATDEEQAAEGGESAGDGEAAAEGDASEE